MTDKGPAFASPPFDGTVAGLLYDRVRNGPDCVLLTWEDLQITTAEVFGVAQEFAAMLRDRDIGPGDTVLTMMEAGPNYIAMFLAASLVGATWVPQAPDAKGPALAHVLSVVQPLLVIAASEAVENLLAAGLGDPSRVMEVEGWAWLPTAGENSLGEPPETEPDAVRAILFTSGTTGPPKGVIVTERMLLASAAGCALASKCDPGDAFLMWEPMHHIGGPQLVIMALVHGARLVVVKRFSASRFWPLVRSEGVNKLHYLGGILEILLKSETRNNEQDHPIVLAFGGGARPETRRDFIQRFSIPIREVFGMTEASSFATVDVRETEDSIGQVLPWMDADVVAEDGQRVGDNVVGELIVRPRYPGLLTPGYLEDPETTARLFRGEWLCTGDLARRDGPGTYYFLGRKTDSLRRRGENISAWDVETALSAHQDIAETAIVGFDSEI